MMVVTHEMGFAHQVNHRVIFMDAGKVVEDCTRDDFFGNADARSPRAKDFLSRSCSTEGRGGLPRPQGSSLPAACSPAPERPAGAS